MKTVIDVYKNTADFSGRSSVWQFVIWVLYYTVVGVTLFFVDSDFRPIGHSIELGPCLIVFVVLNALPNLAVTVRRLHDTDLSGWWFLICAVPFVGPFILLGMTLMPGTKGDNRFGPPPVRN